MTVQRRPNNTLVPTRKGEAPLLAAQRGRWAQMKTVTLSVSALALAPSWSVANADAASALAEFGDTLRRARAQQVAPSPRLTCPEGLEEMVGVSKGAVFSELQAPDIEESVHSRNADPVLLMHYYLRPRKVANDAVGVSAQFPIVTLKLSDTNIVLSVSCK